MLPVHWAGFDLAYHGWTEPIERALAAADSQGARIATPRLGERVEPARLGPPARWWPRLAWLTGAEVPVWSSGVAYLRAARVDAPTTPSAAGASNR
jgi:hypothetical protein